MQWIEDTERHYLLKARRVDFWEQYHRLPTREDLHHFMEERHEI